MSSRRPSLLPRLNLSAVFLTLLAVVIMLVWFYIQDHREEKDYPIYWVAVLWLLTLVFSLWLGNMVIYNFIQKRIEWDASHRISIFLQFVLTLLYSILCINLTYIVFKNTFTNLPPDRNQFILLNIYGLLFLVPVISIQFGVLTLRKWKKAIVDREKLEKAQVQAELITLKSHLSPHFLFNNLNILSSLIQFENRDAQDYLDYFSEVYRYVLKNQSVELIELHKELNFLQAYNFLLEKRYPYGLSVRMAIQSDYESCLLPPLSLQMVLENAIKHNRFSEEEPLLVEIFTKEPPQIVVRNNLQKREVPAGDRTGLGLENIRRRYWLIAHEEIKTEIDDIYFTVKLPLISTK